MTVVQNAPIKVAPNKVAIAATPVAPMPMVVFLITAPITRFLVVSVGASSDLPPAVSRLPNTTLLLALQTASQKVGLTSMLPRSDMISPVSVSTNQFLQRT